MSVLDEGRTPTGITNGAWSSPKGDTRRGIEAGRASLDWRARLLGVLARLLGMVYIDIVPDTPMTVLIVRNGRVTNTLPVARGATLQLTAHGVLRLNVEYCTSQEEGL